MARHSRMTRPTSYTTPSKVQLVSSSILTRSSLPARRRSSSVRLISRSVTAPYMEYLFSRYASR